MLDAICNRCGAMGAVKPDVHDGLRYKRCFSCGGSLKPYTRGADRIREGARLRAVDTRQGTLFAGR